MMALQSFVALYQYKILGELGDPVFGTVRSTGIAAILIIWFVIILINLMIIQNNNKILFSIFIVMAVTIIPVYGEAKAFYYLFPIAIIYNFIIKFRLNNLFTYFIGAVVLLMLLVISNKLIQNYVTGFSLLDLGLIKSIDFDLFYLGNEIKQSTPEQAISISLKDRYVSLYTAYKTLTTSDSIILLFGKGIGNYIMTFEKMKSMLYINAEDWIMYFPLSRFLVSFGLFGTILYTKSFFNIYKLKKNINPTKLNPFIHSIIVSMPAITLIYLISHLYTDGFSDQLFFIYILFLSIIIYFSKIPKNSKQLTMNNISL